MAAAAAAASAKGAASADTKTCDDASQVSAVEWLHAYLPRDSRLWACQFRRHDIVTVHDVLLLDAQDLHEMLRQRTRACADAAHDAHVARLARGAFDTGTDDDDDDEEDSDDTLLRRFMSARAHYVHSAAPYSTRVDAGGHAVQLTPDVLADLQAVTPRRQSLLPVHGVKRMLKAVPR